MASVFTPLGNARIQFFDDDGDPLAGGKVYFYEAGTSTPLDTYADRLAAVTNANPVILDSAGRAGIWLKPQLYKVVLKTSADVTVWTVDGYDGGGSVYRVAVDGQLYTRATADDADINLVKLTSGREAQFGAAAVTTSSGSQRYNASLRAWRPDTSGVQGGSLDIAAGAGAAAGNSAGGAVAITGGTGTGSGNGGDVTLTGGQKSTGLRGAIAVSGMLQLSEITYSAADTTPSVQSGNYMIVANGGAVSITAFDDGRDGQVLILKFSDNNTTLVDAAGLQLAGGSNFNPDANDIVVLVRIASVWYELCRSVN